MTLTLGLFILFFGAFLWHLVLRANPRFLGEGNKLIDEAKAEAEKVLAKADHHSVAVPDQEIQGILPLVHLPDPKPDPKGQEA